MIGKNLRILRKQNRVTQKDLSEYLHITQQAYAKWESGYAQPSIEMVNKVAEYFKVPVTLLIGGTEQEHVSVAQSQMYCKLSKLALMLDSLPENKQKSLIHSFEMIAMSVQ